MRSCYKIFTHTQTRSSQKGCDHATDYVPSSGLLVSTPKVSNFCSSSLPLNAAVANALARSIGFKYRSATCIGQHQPTAAAHVEDTGAADGRIASSKAGEEESRSKHNETDR